MWECDVFVNLRHLISFQTNFVNVTKLPLHRRATRDKPIKQLSKQQSKTSSNGKYKLEERFHSNNKTL